MIVSGLLSRTALAFMNEGMNWPGMGSRMVPTFNLIENEKDVYRLIAEHGKERGGE